MIRDFNSPRIYERSTLDKSLKDLWASLSEISDVGDLQMKQLARRNGETRHPAVKAGHAINPGVHVPTIERRKSHRVRKYRMKAVSVRDVFGLDSDAPDRHGVVEWPKLCQSGVTRRMVRCFSRGLGLRAKPTFV